MLWEWASSQHPSNKVNILNMHSCLQATRFYQGCTCYSKSIFHDVVRTAGSAGPDGRARSLSRAAAFAFWLTTYLACVWLCRQVTGCHPTCGCSCCSSACKIPAASLLPLAALHSRSLCKTNSCSCSSSNWRCRSSSWPSSAGSRLHKHWR